MNSVYNFPVFPANQTKGTIGPATPSGQNRQSIADSFARGCPPRATGTKKLNSGAVCGSLFDRHFASDSKQIP
jgi:hypothetical protein